MYPYIKKQDRRLYDRLNRDAKLMCPEHDDKKISQTRENYIRDLVNSSDFVTTYKSNDKRAREPLKKTISDFSWKHWLLTVFFGLSFGGLTLGIMLSDKKNQPVSKIVAATAIMLFGGLGIGGAAAVDFKRARREFEIDGFYDRLVIRYFDKLKKENSDEFSDEILLNCNPEMLRVIRAILMANMSEQDTKKIQHVATNTPFIGEGANIDNLRRFESDIKYAMKILEKGLTNNPELLSLVNKAYNGYIPQKFVLNSLNQKIK